MDLELADKVVVVTGASKGIGLACAQAARPLARACVVIWVSAVVASTVLVHQHHMLDVAAALMLVFLLRRRYRVPDA